MSRTSSQPAIGIFVDIAAPDAAALYAVYRGEALAALVDERALLCLALERPGAAVAEAMENRPRVA